MSATMALEGAHADEGYANIGGPKDGPVLTMMSKRLRALKKKYNRILQIEENKRQGKAINKEQENVVEQKVAVAALIDEYEKLRQPLMAAVKEEVAEREKELLAEKTTPTEQEEEKEKESEPEKVVEVHENGEVEEPVVSEEVSGSEEAEKPVVTEKESIVTEEAVFPEGEVSDLLKLLYFAHLFDVRSQGEAPSLVWTRVHERSSCLSYDFVTDDSTSPLIEADLDALSLFGSMLTSRPPNETLSHRDALQRCIEHAREWLQNSDRVIQLDAHTSYSRLKERLNRILSSEYFTMTPELQTVSQQTAAAAASAAGQYHPNKDVDHSVPPPTYYVPQESHVPYEFGVPVPVTNGAPPTSTPLVFLADAPVPAFEMPQFGSHGSHEDEGVGEETTEEVEAAEQQQQQQQPNEEVVPPVNEQQQQQQPPPVQQHHGFQPRSGGYPARGGRGGGMQGGGYQGMGGRNGGRGYVNNGGGRGGRGGGRMYSNGGRGGQQFYDQQQPAGNFQPRPNHYGGGGRGGGRGGRGGYPNGPPAPSPPPAATAVAPTSG